MTDTHVSILLCIVAFILGFWLSFYLAQRKPDDAKDAFYRGFKEGRDSVPKQTNNPMPPIASHDYSYDTLEALNAICRALNKIANHLGPKEPKP